MTDTSKGIWIFAEQQEGNINPTVYELIAKAYDLKNAMSCEHDVVAILLGHEIEALVEPLFAYGAEKVIVVDEPALKDYSSRPYQKVLSTLCEKYKPNSFLYAASVIGRELAPRVMWDMRTGLTADAIDLLIDDDGMFVQTTPAYGGKINSHIAIPTARPQMVTVHPQVFTAREPQPGAKGEVIRESVSVSADAQYRVISRTAKELIGRAIKDTDVIVAAGRGVKSREELEKLRELATLLNGELACSRPLVDCGWMEHETQIGQSGVNIKPKLIINVGISGSVQYVSGMKNADCIISINHNADAPIFEVSDYAIVDDYRNVIPSLIHAVKNNK